MYLCRILLLCLLSSSALAEPSLRVATAASFRPTLAKIASAFTTRTGIPLVISAAATGVLYTQISHGARYDILLAADQAHVDRLVKAGYGVADSSFTYAQGQLVLVGQSALPVTPDAVATGLARDGVRLALANPRIAPYGIAAEQALSALGLADKSRPQRILGQNAGQAFQFFSSGNVDYALVSLAQWRNWRHGHAERVWPVPANLYQAIKQYAVLLKNSDHTDSASHSLALTPGVSGHRLKKSILVALQLLPLALFLLQAWLPEKSHLPAQL